MEKLQKTSILSRFMAEMITKIVEKISSYQFKINHVFIGRYDGMRHRSRLHHVRILHGLHGILLRTDTGTDPRGLRSERMRGRFQDTGIRHRRTRIRSRIDRRDDLRQRHRERRYQT